MTKQGFRRNMRGASCGARLIKCGLAGVPCGCLSKCRESRCASHPGAPCRGGVSSLRTRPSRSGRFARRLRRPLKTCAGRACRSRYADAETRSKAAGRSMTELSVTALSGAAPVVRDSSLQTLAIPSPPVQSLRSRSRSRGLARVRICDSRCGGLQHRDEALKTQTNSRRRSLRFTRKRPGHFGPGRSCLPQAISSISGVDGIKAKAPCFCLRRFLRAVIRTSLQSAPNGLRK